MYIDFSALTTANVYHCMTQSVIPRPVAWVLSENENASYNLAPFSYFTPVSSKPPLIMLSIGRKSDGQFKDTRINIEQRKHFVVHIASDNMAADLTETSRELPAGESELNLIEAQLTEIDGFHLPRLAACKVALCCELFSIQEIGDVPQALVFGRVTGMYVDDAVCEEQQPGKYQIMADRIRPLARLGAERYAGFGELIHIPRPK